MRSFQLLRAKSSASWFWQMELVLMGRRLEVTSGVRTAAATGPAERRLNCALLVPNGSVRLLVRKQPTESWVTSSDMPLKILFVR